MGLQFTHDVHPAIADGSLTVTYRAWQRPQVRVGGKYAVGATTVRVTSMSLVPLDSVPEEHRRWVGDADPVWRVDFVRDEPDPPKPAYDVETLRTKLARMDERSHVGSWTRPTLEAIRDRPGVVSTELARSLGRERFEFKSDVRKLTALGLTESLEVGYRLTPLGEQVLAELA